MDFATTIVKVERVTPVFVTGGFRSVSSMIDALRTVDGVGLGRPTAQQPLPSRQILERDMRHVGTQACDQDNFGLTAMICSTQIRQIAENEGVLNASQGDVAQEDVVQAFTGQLETWLRAKANDTEVKMYKPMNFTKAFELHG